MRSIIILLTTTLLVVSITGATASAAAAELTADLATANQLRKEQKHEAARVIYEQWSAAHPQDGDAVFEVAYTLYLEACAEADPQHATDLRLRAKASLKRARELGSTNVLLDGLEKTIGEKGEDLRGFDGSPAVVDLMKRGEQAFSQGKQDEALQLYGEALKIDPRCYAAAVFTGDVYFNRGNFTLADEWFARAVAINGDAETAHRYWADSLVKQKRFAEARDQFIEAVIAEPYNRIPRQALDRFAGTTRKKRHHINELIPMTVVEPEKDGVKINLAPDCDAVAVAYTFARARWLKDARSKYFPPDAAPRHSLPEEVTALRDCLQIIDEMGEAKVSATIWKDARSELKQLSEAGLLESFVLLDRADNGIARDYMSYRAQHRDALIRYVRQSWFGKE